MAELPFLIRAAQLSAPSASTTYRDFPVSEEPLPAALAVNVAGYVLEHRTRVTKVGQETTDDN